MANLTSRQKILQHLKRNRSASAQDIAYALRMTSANARHHLSILAADGRVEVFGRKKESRGRPEKMYRLAGMLAGDNLPALVDALLAEVSANSRIDTLGKYLAGENTIRAAAQSLMQRLGAAVERLNKMQYQARWEAGAEGPRLILGHCPYAAVIEGHPELCQMDGALLAELLGEPVWQATKLEKGAGGMTFCLFIVK